MPLGLASTEAAAIGSTPFVVGWFVAQHLPAIRRLTPRFRRRGGLVLLLVAIGVSIAAMWVLPHKRSNTWVTMEYFHRYGVIFGIFLFAFDWRGRAAVRWLSEATYPIYLYHFFCISVWWTYAVVPLYHAFHPRRVILDSCAFTVGLAGSVAIIVAGRRLLGRHARTLLG
ncbi:MAG: hypothetical protein HY699_17760 [Deltaproteobacteria bacterium]|nr:hypothetical protein [Deltaproteobacteria bacterium]